MFDEIKSRFDEEYESKKYLAEDRLDFKRKYLERLAALKVLIDCISKPGFEGLISEAISENSGPCYPDVLFSDMENLLQHYQKSLEEFNRTFVSEYLHFVSMPKIVEFVSASVGNGNLSKDIIDTIQNKVSITLNEKKWDDLDVYLNLDEELQEADDNAFKNPDRSVMIYERLLQLLDPTCDQISKIQLKLILVSLYQGDVILTRKKLQNMTCKHNDFLTSLISSVENFDGTNYIKTVRENSSEIGVFETQILLKIKNEIC